MKKKDKSDERRWAVGNYFKRSSFGDFLGRDDVRKNGDIKKNKDLWSEKKRT